MTSFEKLALALDIINKCEQPPRLTDDEVKKEMGGDAVVSTKENIEILDKLFKDGNAKFEIDTNGIGHYFSTFQGRLFAGDGGYIQQNKDNATVRQNNLDDLVLRKRNDRLLVKGTIALAIGTFGLVLWEIVKFFFLEKTCR